MKWAAGFCIVICSLFSCISLAASSQDVTTEATSQNYRVLSGRIHKILEYRLQGLFQCDLDTHVDLETNFKRFPKYSDDRDTVLDLIEFYHDTYKVKFPCLQKLNQAEKAFDQMERSKFKIYDQLSKISKDLHTVFLELDPNCESVQVPNRYGDYDPFPCMAGETMLAKTLVNSENYQFLGPEIADFILSLSLDLENSQTRSVDLYAKFRNGRKDTTKLRERFLAAITILTTSTSSLHSYIQAYHFYFFKTALMKSGSAEDAVSVFNTAKLQVDQFRSLAKVAEKRSVRLNLYGRNLDQINYHDIMSGFIACYYRDRSAVYQKWLPVALGYAYETYDFQTHMVDKNRTLKDSIEEFKIDTSRHRNGMKWGIQFCSFR